MIKLLGRVWEHRGGCEVGIRGEGGTKGAAENGESLRDRDDWDEGGVDVGAGK